MDGAHEQKENWREQCKQAQDWISHLESGKARVAPHLPEEDWQGVLDECLRNIEYQAWGAIDRLKGAVRGRELPSSWNWAVLQARLEELLAFLEQNPWQDWVYPERRKKIEEALRAARDEEEHQQKALQRFLKTLEGWDKVLQEPARLRTEDLRPPHEWLQQQLGQSWALWPDLRNAFDEFVVQAEQWERLAVHHHWSNERSRLRKWLRQRERFEAFRAWIDFLREAQRVRETEGGNSPRKYWRELQRKIEDVLETDWEEIPDTLRAWRRDLVYRSALKSWHDEIKDALEQIEDIEGTASQQAAAAFDLLQEFEQGAEVIKGEQGLQILGSALRGLLEGSKKHGQTINMTLYEPNEKRDAAKKLEEWIHDYREQAASYLAKVLKKYMDRVKTALERKDPKKAQEACRRVRNMEVWRERENLGLFESHDTLRPTAIDFESLCERVRQKAKDYQEKERQLEDAQRLCREGRYPQAWVLLNAVKEEGRSWFATGEEPLPPLEREWNSARQKCLAALQQRLDALEKTLNQAWTDGHWPSFWDVWREWKDLVHWGQSTLLPAEQEALRLDARRASWEQRAQIAQKFDQMRTSLLGEDDFARRWEIIRTFERNLQAALNSLRIFEQTAQEYLQRWLGPEEYERYRIASQQAETLESFCRDLRETLQHSGNSVETLRAWVRKNEERFKGLSRQKWREEVLKRRWEQECRPLWDLVVLRVHLHDLRTQLEQNILPEKWPKDLERKYQQLFRAVSRPHWAPALEKAIREDWHYVEEWQSRQEEAQQAWKEIEAVDVERGASLDALREAYALCKEYKDRPSPLQEHFRERFWSLQKAYRERLEKRIEEINSQRSKLKGEERRQALEELRDLLNEHENAFRDATGFREKYRSAVEQHLADLALKKAKQALQGTSVEDMERWDSLTAHEVENAKKLWEKAVQQLEKLQNSLPPEKFDKDYKEYKEALLEARRRSALAALTLSFLRSRRDMATLALWEHVLEQIEGNYRDEDSEWRRVRVYALLQYAGRALFAWPPNPEKYQQAESRLKEALDLLARDKALENEYGAQVRGLFHLREDIQRLHEYLDEIQNLENISSPTWVAANIRHALNHLESNTPQAWQPVLASWLQQWRQALLQHLEPYWAGRRGTSTERLTAVVLGVGLTLRPYSDLRIVFHRVVQDFYFELKQKTETFLEELRFPTATLDASSVNEAREYTDEQIKRLESCRAQWGMLGAALEYVLPRFAQDNASEEPFYLPMPREDIDKYGTKIEEALGWLRVFRNRMLYIEQRAKGAILEQGKVEEIQRMIHPNSASADAEDVVNRFRDHPYYLAVV